MSYLVLYAVTAVLFLAIDAVGIRFLIRPVFEQHVGGLLADPIRLGPAAVFYLFYVGALLVLVTAPLLDGGNYARIALGAAVFGAAAYGTYEFTNLATLEDWRWEMVLTDLAWGTVLTAFAGTAGVAITRALT